MTASEIAWIIVWIALVLLLGVVEVFTLDFIFLMLAVGAAGGLVATLLGAPWWLAFVVFAAVSLLLLALVRPRLLLRLGRGADPRQNGVAGLIGMPGQVALAFTPTAPGQVRLANGETWSARIDTAVTLGKDLDRTPPLGTHVIVTAIEGSTAVVRLAERTTP